jgi:hypothetical protein
MLSSDFTEWSIQFPDFAEFLVESEAGEAPVHLFNPVTRKTFTRPEVHRQANDRSVHDQVSRSDWVRRGKRRPTGFLSQEQNFAEFFAELPAEKAPNRPFCFPVLL